MYTAPIIIHVLARVPHSNLTCRSSIKGSFTPACHQPLHQHVPRYHFYSSWASTEIYFEDDGRVEMLPSTMFFIVAATAFWH